MHKNRIPIIVLVCTCLLAMQVSGLHLHLSGSVDSPPTRVHNLVQDHDHIDHGAEVDVWLLEQLGVSWSKLIPLLFAGVIALLLIPPTIRFRRRSSLPLHVRQCIRWRPPLRAPPLSR